MPRKQYITDLTQAINSHGVDFIHDLRVGDDDGQFKFLFVHNSLKQPVSVTASVTELSDYPDEHCYFFFTADNTPTDIAGLVSSRESSVSGKSISQTLLIISTALRRYVMPGDSDIATRGSQEVDDASDDIEEDDEDFDDYGYGSDVDDAFGINHDALDTIGGYALPTSSYTETTRASRNRARADLRAVKDAGFRVGHHRDLLQGYSCFVSTSIRIAKLGISDAAMQAWRVEASDYLILLIHYPSYKTADELMGAKSSKHGGSSVSMRVGLSKRYKPSLDEAVAAFAVAEQNEQSGTSATHSTSGFRPTFISKSLENLLNEQFLSILEFRAIGLSRSGAESFYVDHRGHSTISSDSIPAQYFDDEPLNDTYPLIVNADHWTNNKSGSELSFPLLAMQMLLRHFVRCTEFCVVCHKKLDSEMEAIKPYVCDEGLCLYQYVNMGFGPSFEHEIIAQPYVVDLLISFAYAQAKAGKLKDFPRGLSMMVPKSFDDHVASPTRTYRSPVPERTVAPALNASLMPDKIVVKLDRRRREILFLKIEDKCPLRQGDWIVIHQDDASGDGPFHCRITETCYYPFVKVGPYINMATAKIEKAEETRLADPAELASLPTEWLPATIETYSLVFDSLHEESKRGAIKNLLECLPSVPEMKKYLTNQRSPDLGRWLDRIPPSALAALRWVIASNRACIMQVYDLDPTTGRPVRKEDCVYGMRDWLPFRFAMGAPDKEKRFMKSVRKTAARLHLSQHPTIFAWHGSRLENWHSIIREGLHFKNIVNGRAYGHGVYHSLELNTAAAYAMSGHTNAIGRTGWPQSILMVYTAIALNEIVNAPAEFTHRNPHLVVQHVDWIQTRYLFVKCSEEDVSTFDDEKPVNERSQDPVFIPRNSDRAALIIPACSSTTGKRRIGNIKPTNSSSKSKKTKGKHFAKSVVIDEADARYGDDGLSDETDIDDVNFLLPEDEDVVLNVAPSIASAPSQTDFVPGELDHSGLPKLPIPEHADTNTTRRLNSDFVVLRKVQESTPLHELGWYIDPTKFDSPYQWIVELHSFHKFENKGQQLPIVEDMRKAGLKSIILEMRFPGSYPMSPPFVRVIKPRFLSLMQGGGGHVTAGGAICMELLTNSGWSAVSSIESVLLQVRMAMASTEPSPARLEGKQHGRQSSYAIGEAVAAYKRACNQHGWQIPPDFDKMVFDS